jgi:DNA-binding CsgD family transcriptional regulator
MEYKSMNAASGKGIASYIADLSSGYLLEENGLNVLFGTERNYSRLAELNENIHAQDYRELLRVLKCILKNGAKNGIGIDCQLEISYRINTKTGSRRVYRKTGLMKGSTKNKIYTWSQIFAIDALNNHDEVSFLWKDKYTSHDDIVSCVSEERQNIFTKTENQILERISEGKSNETIASQLGTSINTVKKHISNMLQKTGAKNRVGLLLQFRDREISG